MGCYDQEKGENQAKWVQMRTNLSVAHYFTIKQFRNTARGMKEQR